MAMRQRLVLPIKRNLIIVIPALLFVSQNVHATNHGGLNINVEMAFGTHNITSRVGVLAFETVQDSNFSFELAFELGCVIT